MDNLVKVNVLLSTYNGQDFLAEQLDSLLVQEGVKIILHVRNDGSTDKTKDILESYKEKFDQVKIEYGNNLGAKWSFMELLKNADTNCDYYSFCDQDDVWLPRKTIAGISAIKKLENETPEAPTLYFSRIQYVDKNLVPTKKTAYQANVSFCNSLIQCSATGCAIIINSVARKTIINKTPSFIMMHDWWCYLVCSTLGCVIYDDNCYLYQRKHLNNLTGHTTSLFRLSEKRIKMLIENKKRNQSFINQIECFHHEFNEIIPTDKKKIIEQFIASNKSICKRLNIIFNSEFSRNCLFEGEYINKENLAFKLLYFFNAF